MSLLEVDEVTVSFGGSAAALTGVNLSVREGEIVGLIGETGSGKTTLARAIVGLNPVQQGRIMFDGADLTALRGRSRRQFRRSGAVQLMFQDPLRALDPQQTVADIVAEPLVVSGLLARADVGARVRQALTAVGLDEAIAGRQPGAISGGQRQRVLLARAIAPRPRLLLADEPVSALDASNRNHVLRLLDDLRTRTGLAIVVIAHDLSSLAGVADRVAVLYGGHIVETGPIGEVLTTPAHPYTALLAASAPIVAGTRDIAPAALRPDRVLPPAPGCVYANRCRFADAACRVTPPMTRTEDRTVACHHAGTHHHADTWRDQLITAR